MAVAPISAPPPSVAEVIVSTRAVANVLVAGGTLVAVASECLSLDRLRLCASLALALAPRRGVVFLCFRRHLVSLLVLLLATFSCLSTI